MSVNLGNKKKELLTSYACTEISFTWGGKWGQPRVKFILMLAYFQTLTVKSQISDINHFVLSFNLLLLFKNKPKGMKRIFL